MIKKLSVHGSPRVPEVGEVVELTNFSTEVLKCEKTGELMVHIDTENMTKKDFEFVRSCGLTVGHPDSGSNVSINAVFRDQADLATMMYVYFSNSIDYEVENLYTEPRLRS